MVDFRGAWPKTLTGFVVVSAGFPVFYFGLAESQRFWPVLQCMHLRRIDAECQRYCLLALRENDNKLIEFGKNKTMEVMWAAGAREVVQEARYAHLVGAARMGKDPKTSVVDQFGRTHDIDNLFVCDGSIMPTQGSANPGLTIMVLAARIADYLTKQGSRIFDSNERSLEPPPMRRDLSPPDTWGHGMLRI